MKKSYVTMLKEDIAPYLIKREKMQLGTGEIYTFEVPNHSDSIQIFRDLTKRYKCWIYIGKNQYKYKSTSRTMKEIADKMEKESIHDIPNPCSEVYIGQREPSRFIPDHMQDAASYAGRFKQEYECNFKQMEKQVNKDKFKSKSTTNIKVNGRDFSLEYPFNTDTSLEVILELTERLAVLNGKIGQLNTINTANEETDNVDLSKIVAVATEEIGEIKDMIEHISDNIV